MKPRLVAGEPGDLQKFFGSFFLKKNKTSFLKKRSKKLLAVWGVAGGRCASGGEHEGE
jgi:hypothetical protein